MNRNLFNYLKGLSIFNKDDLTYYKALPIVSKQYSSSDRFNINEIFKNVDEILEKKSIFVASALYGDSSQGKVSCNLRDILSVKLKGVNLTYSIPLHVDDHLERYDAFYINIIDDQTLTIAFDELFILENYTIQWKNENDYKYEKSTDLKTPFSNHSFKKNSDLFNLILEELDTYFKSMGIFETQENK